MSAGSNAAPADTGASSKHQHSLSASAHAIGAANSMGRMLHASTAQTPQAAPATQSHSVAQPLQHPAELNAAHTAQAPSQPPATNGVSQSSTHVTPTMSQDLQQLRWALERRRTGSAPGAQSLPPLACTSRPGSSSQQPSGKAQAQQPQQTSAQQVAAALTALQAASKRSNSFTSRRLMPLVRHRLHIHCFSSLHQGVLLMLGTA